MLNKCLWNPKDIAVTEVEKFREHINETLNLNLVDYNDLYYWSVRNHVDFWREWWVWAKFLHSSSHSEVVDVSVPMSAIPKWFPGVRMNFAENLLRFNDDRVALYATGEGQKCVKRMTYCELRRRSMQYARALKRVGVQKGDRVAGYLANGTVAVEAMLGAAIIGAVWSCTSPDFGVMGVLERLSQIEPSVIFSVEAVVYNGKIHDHLEKLRAVAERLPTVHTVVVVPFVYEEKDINISAIPKGVVLEKFLSLSGDDDAPVEFEQVPFDHPMFIMYSSGTTGAPKCIVHSVGGTLIQLVKEHRLHCNVQRNDVMLYYTTTGWMMWNWLIAGLYSGCSLLLYDGSPLLPTPSMLWDLVDEVGVTILGTGAKWLAVLENKCVKPKETHSLASLRMILSTGSPLSPASFEYVYRDIKEDLCLGSVSGGTDIISCFMGCNITLPIYAGEIQCRWLGMAIEAWDEAGKPVYDERGELVCTKPFPSMPTQFWNDEGNVKYTKAYFSKYPNVWAHGDFCIINSQTGGIVMLGRSDGTLNPNGVRFGSAEIYNIVERFDEVADSLCIGQRNKDGEERVVLFLKMSDGYELTADLLRKVVVKIRTQLSARHVPAVILSTDDIPYTVSGKKVEVAVRQVIHNESVQNASALKNPEALDLFKDIPELSAW